jgi:hypothetical protein
MKEWMTVHDLSEYLQIPENEIEILVRTRKIPCHDKLGAPRFYKKEIDEWMMEDKGPEIEQHSLPEQKHTIPEIQFLYRGQLITAYTLAASQVLIGKKPWSLLADFIKNTVQKINDSNKEYLLLDEFASFATSITKNYYDYLRISCQLGLIENREGPGRKKHYYPTQYAKDIYIHEDKETIINIVLLSIFDILKSNKETTPNEMHAILLLWFFLTLKCNRIKPTEAYFKKDTDKPNSDYPKIRLYFAKGLCDFLFNGDAGKEQTFLAEWNRYIQ